MTWNQKFTAGIFKRNNMNKKNKGVILIVAVLILTSLMILGSYFLAFTVSESKISSFDKLASQTYYSAEAGINEAIWKLKNDNTTLDGDSTWADDFVDPAKNPDVNGNYWIANFTHSFGGGSYNVTIQNSGMGLGNIVSTATIPIGGGKTSRRIIKTTVFKALASPLQDSAVFTGGPSENIDINFSKVKIEKGNLFSNNNLNISSYSDVQVFDNLETPEKEGFTFAINNFNNNGSITTEAVCAKNRCDSGCPSNSCPRAAISVPLVDFDSVSQYSFKSRAQNNQNCRILCNGTLCSTKCVLSSSEFSDLLWQTGQNGILTLNNEITYVTGLVDLKGGHRLVVNGALVSDDNVYIGENYSWTKQGDKHEGFDQITITRPSPDPNPHPSGLLAKRKINFGPYSSSQPINIEGIVYSNDEVRIISLPQSFNITGAVIGRKFYMASLWQGFNITLDNDIIWYGLGYKIGGEFIEPPVYSPVITVGHWEENY